MSGFGEMLRMAAAAALPPVEGELRLPGLRAPVEVIRDRWGVPHIYAESEHDVFFAQGYVMASERMFQLEFMGRAGLGRLSELFGDLTLPLDRFIRTMGWNRAARRLAEQRTHAELDVLLPAAAGFRAWRERMPAAPPEFVFLGAEPLGPLSDEETMLFGTAAQVLTAYGLSRNWDMELLRAEIAEQLGWEAMMTLFPDVPTEPGVLHTARSGVSPLELLRQAPLVRTGQGSNAWVVSGDRTASAKPLLANDPHLIAQCPSLWYEVHLVCPTLDVRGVAMPFSPGVVIGHNRRIAWGFTNTEGDVQDLYLERLSEDRSAALYDGEWEPVTVHREEIVVRGRESEPEVVEVLETRHGPILDSYLVGIAEPELRAGAITETYALRWVGAERGVSVEALIGMNRAASFQEFREAVRGWRCPGQNMVYADVDGNIGVQVTGDYPVRRRGDGSFPVPGWSSDYEWDGFIPFEELPWAYNPEQGFLVTANNKPHDEAYPHLITRDFLPPYRARRVAELLTARDRHDRDSFAAIHMDTVSLSARATTPHLLRLKPADERQKGALALLADWDHDLAADSAPAALYEVWCVRIADVVLRDRLGPRLFEHYYSRREWSNAFHHQVLPSLLAYPTAAWFGEDGPEARDALLRRALDQALDELTRRLGEDMAAWRWGAIHRVRFAGRLAMIPDLAELFTAGTVEMGGDEQTVCQALYEPGVGYDVVVVPSWRQIVDMADLEASVGTHTTGQSGNPASPHFADLVPLWAEGRYHPLPLSRERVEEIAESRLRLGPEDG